MLVCFRQEVFDYALRMRCEAVLALPLVALTAFAQHTNPFANDVPASGVGKGVFRIYCSPCHGIRAQGGRGPNLRGVYRSDEQDADLFRTISDGIVGTEMQGYGGTISDENIWRIISFLHEAPSAGSVALQGDIPRGRDLFWGKGKCGGCHMVAGKGGRSGPDLTRIGRQRGSDNLRESVVEPSAEIAGGYTAVTVTLTDGRTIKGIERGLDNFTVQVMDSSGKFYSFDKSRIGSLQREARSLMPDNYGHIFSGPEMNDLIAYLSSLRGEGARP